MAVQRARRVIGGACLPQAVALAALLSVPRLRGVALYRTALFLPTILSFVVVGFIWKLILSPLWGVAPMMLGSVGLRGWKGDLIRVVGRMAGDAWNRRKQQPQAPLRTPVRKPGSY